MSDDANAPEAPQEDPRRIKAAARIRPAALLLLTVSILNLVMGAYCLVAAIAAKQHGPNDDWQKTWDAMDPFSRDVFARVGWTTADDLFTGMSYTQLYYGAASSLLSVLAVAGARNMLALQSYKLAMTSAVLTAIPCITPCCGLGQAAGVWAFVLLVQADVRSAFR